MRCATSVVFAAGGAVPTNVRHVDSLLSHFLRRNFRPTVLPERRTAAGSDAFRPPAAEKNRRRAWRCRLCPASGFPVSLQRIRLRYEKKLTGRLTRELFGGLFPLQGAANHHQFTLECRKKKRIVLPGHSHTHHTPVEQSRRSHVFSPSKVRFLRPFYSGRLSADVFINSIYICLILFHYTMPP